MRVYFVTLMYAIGFYYCGHCGIWKRKGLTFWRDKKSTHNYMNTGCVNCKEVSE